VIGVPRPEEVAVAAQDAVETGSRRRAFGADPIPGNPLRALVSPYTWLATTHLLASFWVGVATFTTVVTLLALAAGLMPLALLGVPILVLTVHLVRGLARLERGWYRLSLGVQIEPPQPPPPARSLPRRVWQLVASIRTWREIGYQLLLLPVGAVTMTLTTLAWAAPVALLLLPAYNHALPNGGADLGALQVRSEGVAYAAAALGLLLLLLAPYLVHGLSTVDVAFGRALLGRFSTRELSERVGELERSRRRAVDSVEGERRRIERDLHDGAQQRLVALAMTLGRARARYRGDPTGIGDLLEEAHHEAKQAIVELRDLTRGLHPPVLADRGLDAALSALAARSPVPVTVEMRVPTRPPASIEAIAYFVVAEALTNVAQHAHAKTASVAVRREDGWLRVSVHDDGVGGADPAAGTGLRGLADRVSAVDGRLSVDSPAGGPTTLTVELPCG
jgi:signal transduction histidine kinase